MSALPANPPSRIGHDSGESTVVAGGGISGLTCALLLAESGHRVTLMEASSQLGGLGTFFEHDGRTFEKFYHCMLPSDGPLLSLLDRLQLRHEVYRKPTSFGYAGQRKLHPLNTAMDLLRFSPLRLADRLRVGFTGLYGRMCSDRGLDDITAVEWLTRLSGPRAFETFWKPMLMAKFGDRYHDVPALWFWTRFNREKGESKGEVKGYIRGGYRRIIETLAARLRSLGVTVRLNCQAHSLDLDESGRPVVQTSRGDERFDRMVITTPWPVLQRGAGQGLRRVLPAGAAQIDYQGVINCLLLLTRPLSPHYWVATPQPEFPFDGVVETSTLTNADDRGPRHVVYLTKYLHRSDPRFHTDPMTLGDEWWAALQRLFPDLHDEHLEARYVFHAPFVEPLYTRGFNKARPPEELVPGRVYLATTVQVYPTVTSWNGSVAQAIRTIEAMNTVRAAACAI